MSYITPPVALGAFAAATIAGTSPMQASLAAMRLGSVIYIVPFFFVLNPALIGQGTPTEVVTVFATALLGVFFIGSALQGYVTGIGVMRGGILGYGVRTSLFIAGLAFASPGNVGLGLGHFHMAGLGLVLSLPALLDSWLANRRATQGQHA